jgi:single-strand DNA-binding protein
MASFNKVFLMGNLTRDPEMRVTPSGVTICKFGLAVSRTARSADGSTREETLFIDIDSFGKQAELIGKYMTKGRSLLVEGRLRLDQWESQSGEKRNKIVVALEGFQFLGSRFEGDQNAAPGAESADGARQSESFPVDSAHSKSIADSGDVDEDIPF